MRHRFIPSAYSARHGEYYGDAASDEAMANAFSFVGSGTTSMVGPDGKLSSDQKVDVIGQSLTSLTSIVDSITGSVRSAKKKKKKKKKYVPSGGSGSADAGFLPWLLGGLVLVVGFFALSGKPASAPRAVDARAATVATKSNPRRRRYANSRRRGR